MSSCKVAALLFAISGSAIANEGVFVLAEPVDISSQTVNTSDAFPDDVDFTVEALYPVRNNHFQARIQIRYSCRDTQTGGLVLPCHIRLSAPIARQDSGGHIDALHDARRPAGRHVPSEGAADSTGYFRSTYYADEVAGIVESTIDCTTDWGCLDGTVSFGVGLQSLQDLGAGTGYTLVGDRTPHPSNHWGQPNFLAAVQNVARLFADDYPNAPLRYNDISLQYGGVFDVATATQRGYDWTPPHRTHRLGTNMDIGVPRGNAQRALLLRLYQAEGVRVFQEDAVHWHLIY